MVPKKKTIFILGAGASAPYGYPIGKDLKNEIVGLRGSADLQLTYINAMKYIDVEMGTGSEINSLLNDQFLNIDPFSNLAETLRKSGQFTIDEFLNTHKSLIPFGKLMITYILLRTEREEFLLKDEWCQLIWSRLAKGKLSPKEINPDIGFITFNYDTSLEYIFSENLINTFPEATHEDVCAFFENVPLLHIHGKIKNLSWEKENEKTNMKILGLPNLIVLRLLV